MNIKRLGDAIWDQETRYSDANTSSPITLKSKAQPEIQLLQTGIPCDIQSFLLLARSGIVLKEPFLR